MFPLCDERLGPWGGITGGFWNLWEAGSGRKPSIQNGLRGLSLSGVDTQYVSASFLPELHLEGSLRSKPGRRSLGRCCVLDPLSSQSDLKALPIELREPAKEEMEGVEEPEGMEDARRASSEPTTQGSGEFTETRAASTGPARVCTRSLCIYYSFHSPECENERGSDSCACS